MRKFLTSGKFLIFVVAAIMIATTAISFTYWKSGLEGNSGNSGINISIGHGQALESTVTPLIATNTGDGKYLIPYTKSVVDATKEVTEIEFLYNVKWTWDPLLDTNNTFVGDEGQLTVTCVSIKSQDGSIDFLAQNIFIVELPAATNIVGNDADALPVRIIVKMKEPANREQYETIANSTVRFTFKFEVRSQDDMNQLEE